MKTNNKKDYSSSIVVQNEILPSFNVRLPYYDYHKVFNYSLTGRCQWLFKARQIVVNKSSHKEKFNAYSYWNGFLQCSYLWMLRKLYFLYSLWIWLKCVFVVSIYVFCLIKAFASKFMHLHFFLLKATQF